MEDFEFNDNSKLASTLFLNYTVNVDRPNGAVEINFNDFVAENDVAYPSGATHFKIVTAVGEFDFANAAFDTNQVESAIIPINSDLTAAFTLTPSVVVDTANELFVLVGALFMQEVNGQMYPLKNNVYNPLEIVDVDFFRLKLFVIHL